jgi:hypothetical protein
MIECPETPAAVERAVALDRLPWLLLAACLGIEIGLAVLDAVVNFGAAAAVDSVQGLFNVAREDSLASWFSVAQTWLVGVTFVLLALLARAAGAPARRTAGWIVLAGFFAYMSMDDGASLHERLATASAALTEDTVLDLFPSYRWQLVFLPLFGLLGLFALVFLWRELGRRSSRVLLIAAIACFAAAVGLDFVEGLPDDHPWNVLARLAARYAPDAVWFGRYEPGLDTVYHLVRIVEEVLEMLANTLVWVAILRVAADRVTLLRVRFE